MKPEAYRNAKKKVPTDQKMRKGKAGGIGRSAFHPEMCHGASMPYKDFDFVHVNFGERHLNGATIDNTCTAFATQLQLAVASHETA